MIFVAVLDTQFQVIWASEAAKSNAVSMGSLRLGDLNIAPENVFEIKSHLSSSTRGESALIPSSKHPGKNFVVNRIDRASDELFVLTLEGEESRTATPATGRASKKSQRMLMHELKNHLNAISLSLSLMDRVAASLDPRIAKWSEQIRLSSEALLKDLSAHFEE